MGLHIKYRPQSLEEMIGNEAVKKSILSLFTIEKDRPHTFLLTGPSGVGKTTLGRIIAKMVGCSNMDFHEYNSANTRGIDTFREVMENMNYSGFLSETKVYLFDECHQVTPAAAPAMLKMLEDTPNHVYFILCTTDPDKLLKTILNRCTTYQLSLLSPKEIGMLIDRVLEKENVKDFFPSVRKEIIRIAEGCPRQALVLLDQVIDVLEEKEALDALFTVSIDEADVIDICRELLRNPLWDDIRKKVKIVVDKAEPERIRRMVLGYLTSVLLNSKRNDRVSRMIDIFSESVFYNGKAGIVNMFYLSCIPNQNK